MFIHVYGIRVGESLVIKATKFLFSGSFTSKHLPTT